MTFLIDFENVRNAGMRGTEHMLPTDHVIIFYSEDACSIESRYFMDFDRTGCAVEICKLVKKQKNGLDFYIASKAGEIFGNGYMEKLVIVSKDTGFKAVQDYWTNRAKPQRRVILSDSIEHGLLSAKEHNERYQKVNELLKSRNIHAVYTEYEKTRKLREQLQNAYGETEFSGELAELEEMLKTDKTAKMLYLDTLHRFGRGRGLVLYQSLKQIAGL